MKAARPVLNGEDEETGRKALRLVLTQPGFRQQLKAGVRLQVRQEKTRGAPSKKRRKILLTVRDFSQWGGP